VPEAPSHFYARGLKGTFVAARASLIYRAMSALGSSAASLVKADAVALEGILNEELVLVVPAHVPKHRDRRGLVFVKMQDVLVGAG
jgi:hypothetical protein